MNIKKMKRSISMLLLFAMVIGFMPMGMIKAEASGLGLPMPKRERPTKETMWNPEHIGGTVAGVHHSLFVTDINTVKAIGANNYGQLGNGTTAESLEFVDVLGVDGIGLLTDVVSVSAGSYHSVALKSDGTVWTWGYNNVGRLGDGTTENRYTPVQVIGLTDIVSISSEGLYSMALKIDGTVWAWGNNAGGQLGDGTKINRNTPVQVQGLTDVVSISTSYSHRTTSSGAAHAMALKADGTVWAWGYNGSGQLGDGTTTARLTPAQVLGLEDVVSVSIGDSYSMALKTDGTVWTWGGNGSGQLGDGTTTARRTPVQVVYEPNTSYLTDIVSITAGRNHSMALKADGTVWGWGNNVDGQLGDGTTTRRTTPVQVIGLTDTVSITAENNHSRVLKADGTVWGWGNNVDGQLGDGTKTRKNTPVQISFEGQKEVTIIPQNMLYNFNSPKERNLYEGGKPMLIEWNLISKPVDSFDIYYAPYEGWTDESTWTEIEQNVPVSSLSPSGYTSGISNGQGGFLEGITYKYSWNLPNEFIPHIRIIAVPNYR